MNFEIKGKKFTTDLKKNNLPQISKENQEKRRKKMFVRKRTNSFCNANDYFKQYSDYLKYFDDFLYRKTY